ncbi:MAG: lysine--tRNA ligase [Holosporaceae bacterium]|jgi:lysyl-tRNA synthetase class 1|nr:lysine--tRNA ligase [Holosporaceae bacterium]
MDRSSGVYENAKSWPFMEARKLLSRKNNKEYFLFETGYGPSGLPHIGTFGEVARTTYIMHAFRCLSGSEAKLCAFSDDRDGLRKVPDNIPNKEMVAKYLGFPLTDIPDPFDCHRSFGHHNNSKLMSFLDSFNFQYEFLSSTECYKKGLFNEVLLKILEKHKAILDVMLGSLREERAATYSPFLPISPKTGRVLQVKVEEYRLVTGTIVFRDEDGSLTELPVTDGHCKLQWKVDWAARWTAFRVDYEMAGKDLIDSVNLSGKICRILGGVPPAGFNYELFLDEQGKKISKSKGNGLGIEEWLRYASPESLANFMYASPQSAKRLYFDVIPRQMDDYASHLRNFWKQEPDKQVNNPVWHIHYGSPPKSETEISFSLLLNLVSVCNTDDEQIFWGFIRKYKAGASPETMPFLGKLVKYAINYYRDFVKDRKVYSVPTDLERKALKDLLRELSSLEETVESEDEIQKIVFEVGKRHEFPDLKAWFNCLYRNLLGQEDGPRMGSFIALYGINNAIKLIETVLIEK